MENKKANLFIIGAMKAGTTTFINLLALHREIYISPIKEPNYFIDDLPQSLYKPSLFFDNDTYFNNEFPKPLHLAKIEKENHYQKLFSLVTNEKYLAESSTSYLSAPESASLIKNYNPNAKIIILLRDPLERAFSHYKMDLGLGRIKDSFEHIINDEITQYNKGTLAWSSHLGMSFYKKSIQNYRGLFSDVLLLNFEELIKNKKAVLDEVSKFLAIKPFENMESIQENKTKTLRFQKLFYFLNRIGFKDYFSKLFGSSFKQRLFKLVSKDEITPLTLSNKTKQKIEEIFSKE